MDKLLNELASKAKALRFRQGKTKEIMAKQDRQASERQRESIMNIAKAINDLKETIEEKKFAKSEREDDVAKWAKEYEDELANADENIRRLAEQIKEIDWREQAEKAAQDSQKNLAFNRELLEQKLNLRKNARKKKQAKQKIANNVNKLLPLNYRSYQSRNSMASSNRGYLSGENLLQRLIQQKYQP